MLGLDVNSFVDLLESVAKYLECGICLSIYDNPMDTQCKHTFCLHCIKGWIESNGKVCPECRQSLVTRKRSNSSSNVVVIGNDVILEKNRISDNIINDLKIKCKFESKGCQEVTEFGSLASHLKSCSFRLCSDCGVDENIAKEHNCVEVLKKSNYELKQSFEKQTKELNEMSKVLEIKDKTICDLEKQLYEIIEFTFVPRRVFFGTYWTRVTKFILKRFGIYMITQSPTNRETKIKFNFDFSFKEILEIKYCMDSDIPMLFIKLSHKACEDLKGWFRLRQNNITDETFDVNSDEMDKQFIKIKVNPKDNEKLQELLKKRISNKCIFESIDVFTANQLLNENPSQRDQ